MFTSALISKQNFKIFFVLPKQVKNVLLLLQCLELADNIIVKTPLSRIFESRVLPESSSSSIGKILFSASKKLQQDSFFDIFMFIDGRGNGARQTLINI